MLDILSSPLRGYIAQNLQFYLSKYIEGIQLEGLGLFGGDLVLNDLEIKRHVLVESLEIPSSFDFSRGFIRELRIHIPWTQLLSQPIEVKLYTIELILTARDDSKAPARRPSRSRSVESTASASAARDAPDIETPKSGWLRDTLHKILANVSIQINNLVLKYEQDDMVLSVALGTLDCYAVNDKKGWLRSFMEPQGPTQVISRAIDARDLTIFLDRYTSDRKTSDRAPGDTIHRRVVGYELPVLSRSTISVRARMSLKPGAEQDNDSAGKPTKASTSYTPSQSIDPFFQYSIGRRDLIPTTEIDVFIGELAFSLSDRQLEMLGELLQRALHPRHDTPRADEIDVTPDEVSVVRGYSEVQLEDDATTATSSVATIPPEGFAAKKSSWLSWAMETLGGPQDDEEDELISEILAETKEALRRSDEAKKRSAATAASALKKKTSSSVSDSYHRQATTRVICCRVCVNSTILTLRKHEDNAEDTSAEGNPEGPDTSIEEQYVPVANVGLVKVSNTSKVKAKLSKPASEVCSLTLTYTALEFITTRGEGVEPITDVVFEVERVKMAYLHRSSSRRDATPILAWGEVLDSEEPRASFSSSFSECVSHPYFVASFFGEEARSHGRHESRSFEIVKVSQDMEIPVWKTIERRKTSVQSMQTDVANALCSCTVLASGKKVPCVPIAQLNTVAKAAVASIGVHDRKLDEASLSAAVVKAWEQHCFQEPVDFLYLTAGIDSVCVTYHSIRDPDQSAIKNLNQSLLPLLLQTLSQNCLHSCQPSKAGDSLDFRARSKHSALRLRYYVAAGLRDEDSTSDPTLTTRPLQAKEKRCGLNIVDASLGPVVLALKPPEIEDIFTLLRLTKAKGADANSVDSVKLTGPDPEHVVKPSVHALRLITWHSVHATVPLQSTSQSSNGAHVVEVAGREFAWLTSRKADEEDGAWTRKLTVAAASAQISHARPAVAKPLMDAPLVEILAAKWISSGHADEKAESKTEIGVGRVSALIEWGHIWQSATAIDSVLQSFGLIAYGFTDVKLAGSAQPRVICAEACNWQLSQVSKIPREGSFDRVVRADIASCVVYELQKRSGAMRTVFESGIVQAPSVDRAHQNGRSQMLKLKLQESKSTQHSYIDIQGRVAHFNFGLETLARCISGADEFIQSLRARSSGSSEVSSSAPPSKVSVDKKAAYWNMAINLRGDGAVIQLTSALVADIAPLAIVSDPALHNNRRAAIEPGGSVKMTASCDYIRVKNIWKALQTSAADLIKLEDISVSVLYVQDVISSMERTSYDLTVVARGVSFRVDRLALQHFLRVASLGARAKRGRGPQEQSGEGSLSDHADPQKAIKHRSLRMSCQIECLDASFESTITSRSGKETSVIPRLQVHDIGVALRRATYRPKSDASELYRGPFTDFQFSIADLDAWQLQFSPCWRVPQERGGRRFGNLARLPEHDFLAVLVCLDFDELTRVAEAIGSRAGAEPNERRSSPMAAWQRVNRLAQEYREWLNGSPNRAQNVEIVKNSTSPLLATVKAKPMQGGKAPPVLACYFRDYGESHDPEKTTIAASMENIDFVLSSSTIAALASLLDCRSRSPANHGEGQDTMPKPGLQATSPEQSTHTPPSLTAPQPREKVFSIVTGIVRVYLPDESWRCHDTGLSSDEERVPPPCACFVVNQVSVASASWCDISLDGLGYPPFNATLLPRCPTKPPQLQRLGSQTTMDRGMTRRTSRLGNISGTLVQWELSNGTGMADARPIDSKLGRILRLNLVSRDCEVFLLPFSVTSVEETRDGGACTAATISITKVRAEVRKKIFDGIVLGVVDLLGSVSALQISTLSWKKGHAVHEVSRDVAAKDTSSRSTRLEIICDGVDAVAVHESTSIHLRLGSLGVVQSSPAGQGRSGEFFLQNVVVASRFSNTSATTTEELVLGPNSDPAAWQLNVGNIPEKLVSGRWVAPGDNIEGAESSLFIDVQGFQCHGSSQFVDAIVSYIHVKGADSRRRDVPHRSDERGSRHGPTTVASLKKKLGVKVLLGPSVATYWVQEMVSAGTSAEKERSAAALWTGVEQVFVNLEVGSGGENKLIDESEERFVRPINRFITVPVMSIAANFDGMVLRSSASFSPLEVRFKNDSLSAIPGQIHSSWGKFLTVTNQSSARTTLLQECTVRVTGSREVVYERSSATNVLFATSLASTAFQIDPSAMLFKVSSVSLTSLLDFVAKFNASRRREVVEDERRTRYHPSNDRSSFTGDALRESDDDLATLHRRTERVSSSPRPGDVVFSEVLLIETASGPVPSVDLRQLDLTVDFEPSRGYNHENEIGNEEDKNATPYDETAEVLRWIDLVNSPWNLASADSIGEEYAPQLPENQTISWMSMKWCYHLPRRISEIVMNPVPMPPTGVPSEWPSWEWKEATSNKGDPQQYVRWCDIVCQLRAWNSVKKCYVLVAEFVVPWEAADSDENATRTLEAKGSFGELMSLWFDEDSEDQDKAKFARVLEVTCSRRVLALRDAMASHKWELRWRSPLSGEQDKHRRLHVSALLAASLNIRSQLVESAFERTSLQIALPRVGAAVAYVQGQDDTSHDILSAELTDTSVSLVAYAGDGGSSITWQSMLQVTFENLAQLLTVPIVPRVTVHSQIDRNSRTGTNISLALGDVHLYLPQSAILLLSSIPDILNVKPSRLDQVREAASPSSLLPVLRVQLVNLCGRDLLYRQSGTSECLELHAGKIDTYSWLTLAGEPCYDSLQFAFASIGDQHSTGTPSEWCDPCRIREQVATGRYFKAVGFLWVKVERSGTEITVILRGAINVLSCVPEPLWLHLQHDRSDATTASHLVPCDDPSECWARATAVLSGEALMWSDMPMSGVLTDIMAPALRFETASVLVNSAQAGASLSKSKPVDLRGLPTEFDPVATNDPSDETRQFQESRRRAVVRIDGSTVDQASPRFVVVEAVRVRERASLPNDFADAKISNRYTWTDVFVLPSVQVRNFCDASMHVKLFGTKLEGEDVVVPAQSVSYCSTLDPETLSKVVLLDSSGSVSAVCLIGNGAVSSGCITRLGPLRVELIPPSVKSPLLQIVLRRQLMLVNHSSANLLFKLKATESDRGTINSSSQTVVVPVQSDCEVSPCEEIVPDKESGSYALIVCIGNQSLDDSATTKYSSEVVLTLNSSSNKLIVSCPIESATTSEDPETEEQLSLPLVVATESTGDGMIKIVVKPLVTVHNDTGLTLRLSPLRSQSEPVSPAIVESGSVWEVPLRHERAESDTRTRSGSALASWITSALGFSASKAKHRSTSSMGFGAEQSQTMTCSFGVSVCGDAADDGVFEWADKVSIRIPEILPNGILLASSSRAYPPPSSVAPRHRRIVRHSKMRHVMLSVTVSQIDSTTIHVLLFVDRQSPVAIENLWRNPIGIRAMSSTITTPDAIAGQYYMEYDWSVQQRRVRPSKIQEASDAQSLQSWLMASSSASRGETTEQGTKKFQIGLAAYGWSNVLWQVPGIQFARFDVPESSPTPVFLVAVTFRAGTWLISVSCLNDPASPSSRSLQSAPQLVAQPPDFEADSRSLPNRFRFIVSSDSVQIHCCDEHTISPSTMERRSSDTAMVYAEILRITVQLPCIAFVSTSEAPESVQTEARLGYLDYVRAYNTLFIGLGSLEVEHFFETCNFPVILSMASRDLDRQVTHSSIGLDLTAKHDGHAKFLSGIMSTSLADQSERCLSLRVIHVNARKPAIVPSYFQNVELTVAPAGIQVDDELAAHLQIFLRPIGDALASRSRNLKLRLESQNSGPWRVICRDRIRATSQLRVFADRLEISDLEITITARMSIPVLNSLDGTPVRFSARKMRRVFTFSDQLMKDLAAEYVSDIVVRSPVLVMSLNIFGNPAGFFRSVGTGVRDLFEIPIAVASRDGFNPWILTRGVLSGVASLIGHISAAALSSLSGFSYSISRTVDHLILTPEQLRRRHYVRPTRVTSGITGGLGSLGSSVVGAATGIVSTPIAIYQEKQELGHRAGVSDVVGGLGMGLVGIVARPMGGLASLLAMTSDGILYGTGIGERMHGVDDEDEFLGRTAFEARPNDEIRAKLKILRDPSVDVLVLAHGAWINPSSTLLQARSKQLRSLSASELGDSRVREVFSDEDKVNSAVVVSVICTKSTLFVVGMCTASSSDTDPFDYEIITKTAVADIHAIEESLTAPSRLDVGVRTSNGSVWYHLRLVPSQRRTLSHNLRQWLHDAHGRGFPAL